MSYKVNGFLAVMFAVAMLPSGEATASSMTGAQLSALCKANMGGSGNALEAAECLGFIVGVSDTFDCLEKNHGFAWNSNAEFNQPQLVGVVLTWLDEHPSAHSYEAHRVVGAALAHAFPCK